jgi:pyruvate,water dikinase
MELFVSNLVTVIKMGTSFMNTITASITTPSGSLPDSINGIKADTLSQLSSFGFQVPVWMTIPSTVFNEYIPKAILEQSSEEIAAFVKNVTLDDSLIASIHNWLYKHGLEDEFLAVRTSICTDSSCEHTYSGQLKTHLCVRMNELPEAILDIWASPFSAKATAYRAQWGIAPSEVRIGIIIQKMIPSEVSGVAMCFDPSSGSRSTIAITSAYGINDNNSTLHTEYDLYNVNFSGKTPSRVSKVYEKKNRIIPNLLTGSGTTISPVPYGMRSRSSLSAPQVMALATITRALSLKTAKPQIIDWALFEGKFHILQSRAVTSLENIPDTTEPPRKWQIPSSPLYSSDYISPLIYSIVKKCNSEAFQTFYDKSHHGRTATGKCFDFLGYQNGHMYIDKKIHDELMFSLPFGVVSIANSENISPLTEACTYIKSASEINRIEKRLKKLLSTPQDSIQYRSFLDCTFSELLDAFIEVEKQLSQLWELFFINQHYINSFGGLHLNTNRKQQHQLQVLLDQANFTTANAGIFGELMNICCIADAINARPSMKQLFEKCSTSEIRRKLGLDASIVPDDKDISIAIIRKLLLKHIETINCGIADLTDFNSDSKKLDTSINILRIYVKNGITSKSLLLNNKKNEDTAISDKKFSFSLSNFRKKYTFRKLKKLSAQKAPLNKMASTRLKQLKHYIELLGKKFFAEGVICEPMDIQYVTSTEIFDYIRGQSVTSNLKNLISIRKQELQSRSTSGINKEIFSTHGVVYHSASDLNFHSNKLQNISLLQGIGNEIDAVSGKIILEEQLHEIDSLKDSILVVRNSNPDWIPYLPLIKGLIIQKGSLNSELSLACSILKIPMILIENCSIKEFKDDEQVELDSNSGKISILTRN